MQKLMVQKYLTFFLEFHHSLTGDFTLNYPSKMRTFTGAEDDFNDYHLNYC